MYVSCIKQFWTIVTVKKVKYITRLQALVDKKKVVITEATIQDALRLDDAEGVECLPNEEILTELARIGYKKPSTKLTFYKAFFSSRWKFLIHTILQCMSAKRTSWNEFSSPMASAVIRLSSGRKFNFSKKQVGDLSTHTIKYTSPTLTQKVFANMRRVGKGIFEVKTPLFESMVVAQEVGKGVVDEMHDEGVPGVGIIAEGVVSAANDEVPTADEELSIPSPTLPTPPPQPSHDIPSTSQAQPTPPPSPHVQPQSPQPQPQHDTISMNLLQEVMYTCTAQTRRVEHLELDKIAQALEITKLKKRVKKLERRNKGRMITDMDQDVDVVLEEAKDILDIVKDGQDADVQEDESEPIKVQKVVDVVTTAKIITEVVTAASETITAASTNITTANAQVPAATTAAALKLTIDPSRKRKGVVIRDPEESTTTTSTIIHSEAKSKDKGKGILVDEPKPLKKQAQIKQDEKYARELEAELNKTIDWDEVIHHVNKKAKEDPTVKRALKRINETPAEKAAKRKKLDEDVEELKRHLQIVSNEDDDVYTEATPLARKKNQQSVHGQAKVKSWKLLESCDRNGTENVVADYLSQIKNDETSDDSEVDDNFPGETLMEINTKDEPWFAYFANYLVSDIIPKGMVYQQKNKFFSDLKHYFWEEPYLFKVCSDGMIRRCVSGLETQTILDQCHHGSIGGHYGPNRTAKKVLDSGFTVQPSSKKLILKFSFAKQAKILEIFQNVMRCP
nr:reverse transcriptase domain-containing protein [Tanacetum cinerariifolium]